MKRGGFTLAELLVALALTALAVGVVTEGVRRSLAFEARLAEARDDRESVTAALAALRSRLETAVAATAPQADTGPARPAPVSPPEQPTGAAENAAEPAGPAQEEAVLFEGGSAVMVFLAADPGYPARPGLYEYRLAVTAAGDGEAPLHALVLSRRALNDLSEFAAGGEAQSWTLMTASEPMQLSYAGSDGGWRGDWQDDTALPAQVRIEFGGEDGPPPFIASLPALPPEAEEEEAAKEVVP